MSDEEKKELVESEDQTADEAAQNEAEATASSTDANGSSEASSDEPKPPPPPKMSKEELREVTMELAVHLGETEKQAIRQIEGVVKARGREFSMEMLEKTLEVEREGGMMINNGTRRRTAGGVFFYLVRGQLSNQERYDIFPGMRRYAAPPTEQIYPLFEWENRKEVVQAAMEKSGEAEEVTVTLRGRPEGEVEKRHELVIFSMHYQPPLPTMPRGVPEFPDQPTQYVVYVSDRQWQNVEAQMSQDNKDMLIVTGFCFYDEEVGAISVHTTHITTRYLDKKKKQEREQRQQESAEGDTNKKDKQAKPKGKGKGKGKDKPPRQEKAVQREPAPDFESMVDTSKYPEDVAKKLVELYKAQSTFQKRVTEIESKPADEQYGLEMARKLLKSTEDQIAAIEKEHNS